MNSHGKPMYRHTEVGHLVREMMKKHTAVPVEILEKWSTRDIRSAVATIAKGKRSLDARSADALKHSKAMQRKHYIRNQGPLASSFHEDFYSHICDEQVEEDAWASTSSAACPQPQQQQQQPEEKDSDSDTEEEVEVSQEDLETVSSNK